MNPMLHNALENPLCRPPAMPAMLDRLNALAMARWAIMVMTDAPVSERDMAQSTMLFFRSEAWDDMKRDAERNMADRMAVSVVQTKIEPRGTTCLTRFRWRIGSDSSMFFD